MTKHEKYFAYKLIDWLEQTGNWKYIESLFKDIEQQKIQAGEFLGVNDSAINQDFRWNKGELNMLHEIMRLPKTAGSYIKRNFDEAENEAFMSRVKGLPEL